MTGVWALIPVKALAHGKSRLARRYSPTERRDLSLAMLRDVLSAVTGASGIEGCLVIHSDDVVDEIAGELGAESHVERSTTSDLNDALEQGLQVLHETYGAAAALILPADLPLITSSAIDRLLDDASSSAGITICPSHDGDGTNALLVCPPLAARPSFGPGSFHRHMNNARDSGVGVRSLEISEFALDIDEPGDLDRLLEIDARTRAGDLLRGLASR